MRQSREASFAEAPGEAASEPPETTSLETALTRDDGARTMKDELV